MTLIKSRGAESQIPSGFPGTRRQTINSSHKFQSASHETAFHKNTFTDLLKTFLRLKIISIYLKSVISAAQLSANSIQLNGTVTEISKKKKATCEYMQNRSLLSESQSNHRESSPPQLPFSRIPSYLRYSQTHSEYWTWALFTSVLEAPLRASVADSVTFEENSTACSANLPGTTS